MSLLHTASRRAGSAADRLRPAPELEGWPNFTHSPPEPPRPVCQPARPELRCLIAARSLDAGGLPIVAAFLARNLPAYGIATEVLDIRDENSHLSPVGEALRAEGIPVRLELTASAELWNEDRRPGVVSAHGVMPRQVIATARRAGVPWVETLHGMHDFMDGEADWRVEGERSKGISVITAVSQEVRTAYLAGNSSYPAERAVAIPNGLQARGFDLRDRGALRRHLRLADEDFLFACLARHCSQKNTFGLVAAFGALAAHCPNAHLAIAGPAGAPGYLRRVLRLRESLPGAGRIHIRGNLNNRWALLAAADALVMDSFFEGWPLVPMEALSMGLPVVMSHVAGAVDQIGSEDSRGYVVPNPAGDPQAVTWDVIREARYAPQGNQGQLVAAMEAVVAERRRYAANRAALAAESAARFSGDVCAGRHAAVLKAAAAGAPPPPGPEMLAQTR
jgi:glycosyltransferase involved in cell wall biosynthesis